MLINLGTNLQSMGKCFGSCWKNHELLYWKTISSMLTSINDIKSRTWQNVFIRILL